MPCDPLKPKPKRIRREKLELTYLRDLVGVLEDKLLLLSSKRLNRLEYGDDVVEQAVSFMTANTRNDGVSMWFEMAAQQLKGRSLAVEENQKLRYSIAYHNELVGKLKSVICKLFANGASPENIDPLLCLQPNLRLKFWDFSSTVDEDIFADQLAKNARLKLEMQQQVAPSTPNTMNVDWGLSRGKMEVKRHPRIEDCVVLKMHCSTIVPFQLEVAARAYWRFCCLEHGELLDKGIVNVSPGTIARSFSLDLSFEGLTSSVLGKYTCQTHVKDNVVTIAWVEYANVSEFAGIKFNGLQYQKQAYMKLHCVPHEDPGEISTSTVVETFFETIPIFHDQILNRLEQTKAFINAAHHSHTKLNKLVCQHMTHLLLDEDWKATFGNVS